MHWTVIAMLNKFLSKLWGEFCKVGMIGNETIFKKSKCFLCHCLLSQNEELSYSENASQYSFNYVSSRGKRFQILHISMYNS